MTLAEKELNILDNRQDNDILVKFNEKIRVATYDETTSIGQEVDNEKINDNPINLEQGLKRKGMFLNLKVGQKAI